MKRERLYGFDNARFFLIFAVVLGHFLEITPSFPEKNLILRLIYSFHMPAFLFFSGWFAKFRPKKIAFHLLYPYLLFQILYLLSSQFFWTRKPQTIQFSQPYWILWFLMAIIIYYSALPLVDVKSPRKQAVVLLVSLLAALLAGRDRRMTYLFSAGRVFTFFPFFLLGFYGGQKKTPAPAQQPLKLRIALGCLSAGAVIASCVFLAKKESYTLEMMYGSYPYESTHSGPLQRLVLYAIALAWIAFFLTVLVPGLKKKIPVISTLGKNTFPIFVLHGLVVRYLGYRQMGLIRNLPMGLLGTCLLLLAFGNPAVSWFFQHFLTGWWMERLWDRFSLRGKEKARRG